MKSFCALGLGLVVILGVFSWTHFSGRTAAMRTDPKGAGGSLASVSTTANGDDSRRLSLRLSDMEGRVAALEKRADGGAENQLLIDMGESLDYAVKQSAKNAQEIQDTKARLERLMVREQVVSERTIRSLEAQLEIMSAEISKRTGRR